MVEAVGRVGEGVATQSVQGFHLVIIQYWRCGTWVSHSTSMLCLDECLYFQLVTVESAFLETRNHYVSRRSTLSNTP